MKNLYEEPNMDVIKIRAFENIVCASDGVTDEGVFEDGTGIENPFKPMPNGRIE